VSVWLKLQLRSFLILFSVYNELVSDITQPTEDVLKEYIVKRKQFRKNAFHQTFPRIQEAMATRPAHVPGTLAYARDPSPESDLSGSSDEDKSEEPSKQILSALLDAILDNLSEHLRHSLIQSRGQEYNLGVYALYCDL